MVQLFDISGWDEKPWFSTGGTRAKKYLQNPDTGDYYYFKKSYKKKVLNYTYEFWSEIIASEIGIILGFNILQYHLAIIGDEIGCISKSMIESDQELNEGGKYLTAHDSTFDPDIKASRKQYSFQFIVKALKVFGLKKYVENIIEVIVFDALIGNSDRHQENWAFITRWDQSDNPVAEKAKKFFLPPKTKKSRWNKRISRYDNRKQRRKQNDKIDKLVKLFFTNVESFSSIYDNGSSLGRELADHKIQHILKNEQELQAYICRGTSEIHWHGDKVSHFTLVKNLLDSKHGEIVTKVIENLSSKFEATKIETIIEDIDNLVPVTLHHYKLPDLRKRLIAKFINSRFQKLRALIHERL